MSEYAALLTLKVSGGATAEDGESAAHIVLGRITTILEREGMSVELASWEAIRDE
jgi:hypothetical protein